MAVFETTQPMHTNMRPLGFVMNTLAALTEWNDRRVTRNVLENLSDRELEDIGLTRGDVAGI